MHGPSNILVTCQSENSSCQAGHSSLSGFNNGAMYADNGESWKMSMLLHGSFISLDNELEGIYRLFYWDFNSFFFWLWNIPIITCCILYKSQAFMTRVVALNI